MSDHWSCSIRLAKGKPGDRIFDEQLDFVRELLSRSFPASCGYEIFGTRLGGPLDGVHWSVTRGPFTAELGVQRYARVRSGNLPRIDELRIVANAGLGDACAVDSGLERRVVGWALARWGLGGVGLGMLWLGTSGILTGWAQLLMLLSAAAVWRSTMIRLARRAGHTPALPSAQAPTALPAPQVVEGLRRWRQLLPALAARKEQLESACGLPPFRNPGHVEVPGPSRDASAPLALPPAHVSVPLS